VSDGQTDRRTDGIASTELAMRALRRAVKTGYQLKVYIRLLFSRLTDMANTN